MLLTVVVVTYNSALAIEQTLASVRDAVSHLDAEIFVIDNASSDRSAFVAERILGEQGIVVRMSEDLGYGTAINVGAKRARGRYLLMMNDDVTVTSASIDRLIATLQQHPTVAMVGPQLCDPDGAPSSTILRWSPGWRDELERVRDRLMGTSVRHKVPDGDVVEVEVLLCACALIETQFFRNIGGFNEVFFMYGEDVDLCRRIMSLGLNVTVDTRAVAIHHQDEELARRPKGRGFFERVVDSNDIYYRIWLSRPSRVLLHLWQMIGRKDQPYRAVYHLNHALRRGTSLRRQRWPDPLMPIEDSDQSRPP